MKNTSPCKSSRYLRFTFFFSPFCVEEKFAFMICYTEVIVSYVVEWDILKFKGNGEKLVSTI